MSVKNKQLATCRHQNKDIRGAFGALVVVPRPDRHLMPKERPFQPGLAAVRCGAEIARAFRWSAHCH
jgi:hypothetical protein